MKKILPLLALTTGIAFAECKVKKDTDRMTEVVSIHIECDEKSGAGNIFSINVNKEKGVLKFNSLTLLLKDDAPKIFFQQKDELRSLIGQEIRIKFNKDDPIIGKAIMFGDETRDFANGFLFSDDRKMRISEPLEKLLIEYHNTSANLEYLELDISELNNLIK